MAGNIIYAGYGFHKDDITNTELLNFAISNDKEAVSLLFEDSLGDSFDGIIDNTSEKEQETVASDITEWTDGVSGGKERYIAEVINMIEGDVVVKGKHGFIYFEKFVMPSGKGERICSAEEIRHMFEKYFPESAMYFGLICKKKSEKQYHIANL